MDILSKQVIRSFFLCFLNLFIVITTHSQTKVERWSIYEIELKGPSSGNPFTDVQLSAEFSKGDRVKTINGFYDGNGIYKVRFMPEEEGIWKYVTSSSQKKLSGKKGKFTCTAATGDNHGPVGPKYQYHFAYADGTPYYPFGTTAYAWTTQPDSIQKQTIETLKGTPFNKIRMAVFPKDYKFNRDDPPMLPYEGSVEDGFDWERFYTPYFQKLDSQVLSMLELGIEADLIFFMPYDRWGFTEMTPQQDSLYCTYLVNRYGAFRNIWWSLANEWHFVETKSVDDWNKMGNLVDQMDPYDHLLSIHNHPEKRYDWGQEWISHVSVQDPDMLVARDQRVKYGKPTINDESEYEGDVLYHWGNLSGREMTHRIWYGIINGVYGTHGEVFYHPDDIMWWAKGGKLYGESPERIRFLREIVEEMPENAINTYAPHWKWLRKTIAIENEYYLLYFGPHQPAKWEFELLENAEYSVEIIDPWEMTIDKLEGTYSGAFEVQLPDRQPYLALRVQKIK